MLRGLGRNIHRIWLVADFALCITLFSAIAYSPTYESSGGLARYGALPIGFVAMLTGMGWQIVLGRFRVYESHRKTGAY